MWHFFAARKVVRADRDCYSLQRNRRDRRDYADHDLRHLELSGSLPPFMATSAVSPILYFAIERRIESLRATINQHNSHFGSQDCTATSELRPGSRRPNNNR